MKKLVIFFVIFFNIVNATTLQDAREIKEEYGTLSAISAYKKLIKKNNPDAMYDLARIYIKGDGIDKNITKAHNLLLKASKLNHHQATYTLSKLYLSKKSVFFDKRKAYNTIIDSANAGHNKSQTLLGKFLLFGIAVDKDYEKALYYFKEASKRKDYAANCYIAFMYASGSGVFPNFGRAHVFAKDQYEKGNKLCKKVWKDYNLGKYPKDNSWKIGSYNKPVK